MTDKKITEQEQEDFLKKTWAERDRKIAQAYEWIDQEMCKIKRAASRSGETPDRDAIAILDLELGKRVSKAEAECVNKVRAFGARMYISSDSVERLEGDTYWLRVHIRDLVQEGFTVFVPRGLYPERNAVPIRRR